MGIRKSNFKIVFYIVIVCDVFTISYTVMTVHDVDLSHKNLEKVYNFGNYVTFLTHIASCMVMTVNDAGVEWGSCGGWESDDYRGGYVIGDKLKYRFPSLFAVDTFRHFGPRILNLQIKSQFLTRKLSFLTNFVKVNKQICRYKVHK